MNRCLASHLLLSIAILLLSGSLAGCFGLVVVEDESALGRYIGEVTPILEEWAAIVNDWEDKANDPERWLYLALDAEACCDRMEIVISRWDAVIPPDEAKEFHFWTQLAMDYEKEAFGVMAEYYSLDEYVTSEEVDRLRELPRELWILKDKALFKADEAYPK